MNLFFHDEEEEDKYYLLNKRGKRVDGAVWDNEPLLQSGVFLICSNKLYTVLGDVIKDFEADYIYVIINFWVYYKRDGVCYIARLEPIGIKFKLRAETPVEDVGFLSYDGCVVMQGGQWVIYTYSYGCLTEDKTVPDVIVTSDRVIQLLQKGFSTHYLSYLARFDDDIKVKQMLTIYNTFDVWKQTNMDFVKIIKKLSELTGDYSVEQIGSIIGLKSYIVSVIMQYLEIKDFVNT